MTVALPLEVTVPAVAVKEAVVEETGTVTDTGTDSSASLEDRETIDPPGGAAPDSVTVQVEAALEVRLEGMHCSEERLTGITRERTRGNEVAPRAALMVAIWLVVMAPAVAVKAADEEEAGTVTEPGTVSVALLDDKATAVPPAGAALESVTLHESPAPDARLEAPH